MAIMGAEKLEGGIGDKSSGSDEIPALVSGQISAMRGIQ